MDYSPPHVLSCISVWTNEAWGELATAIRVRRDQLRLTQRDLANTAQVHINTVKEIESGRVFARYPPTLTAIAIALGWTPESPRAVLDGKHAQLALPPADARPQTITVEEAIEADLTLTDDDRRQLQGQLRTLRRLRALERRISQDGPQDQ